MCNARIIEPERIMNRSIVITGASSAIGQAIARRLAAPGDRLLLQCHRHAGSLDDFGGWPPAEYRVVSADFSRPPQLAAFCSDLGETDLLVNAAAVTATELLPNLEPAQIDLMLDVNIRALVAICRAVLPGMLVRRRGVIVNLSSVAAGRGNRGQSVYAGSKGFVEAFTRALAAEYGGRGIRCNAVAPGAIDAGSLKALLSYAGDEVKQSTVAGRLGTPEDVAAAVAFLCSDGGGFVNGHCLAVDGGFSRGV
jgi:NAD(P)-dependent dehydrogenase (short-subunit alcohol dehydrogenase family)